MNESNANAKPALAAWAPLGAAALALGLAGWAAYDAHVSAESLREALGARLGEQAARQKASSQAIDTLTQELKDAQNRVREMEGRLSEYAGQRVALEEMARELARAPDDWLLAEIEQTLNIASRELTLAGNVRAALSALQGADQRLARADKPQMAALRRAIAQDMERLKALPVSDTQGISVKLETLMGLTSTLPLAVPDALAASPREAKPDDVEDNWFVRLFKDFWHEVRQLVRIREVGTQDPALLSPQQSYFLRENLKLRLLSARTALIARDETNYKEDLRLARDMLARHFDAKAKVNVNALATLKQLADNPLSIAAPDITVSLNAVRAARAASEKR
ncbi:MAG: uroporphyrinogen-III C-methyltransferase [Betaproteobacteria bacterium]|nr:uroporphyrinogen-III C-methyltransferase [Betaproteobacteria bacterium]